MLEQFGPYKVVRKIGRGGMGAVYEGVHESNNERCAIKVLADWIADDDEFRDRFMGEIETLKNLDHQNIVRMTAFGEQRGTLFYTMELVEGPNLHEMLKEGYTFSWEEVVEIAIQICAALQHAHDRGIIHRDLKPANLMWSENGQGPIKLTDFGIAKFFHASQMTMAGGVIGTADYMSPEQAAAGTITSRSDLYSLGSVMYSLLTKRPPFRGPSKTQVLDDLLNQAPLPLGKLVFGIPDALESIVAQLLEKDPKKRVAEAQRNRDADNPLVRTTDNGAARTGKLLQAMLHAHRAGKLESHEDFELGDRPQSKTDSSGTGSDQIGRGEKTVATDQTALGTALPVTNVDNALTPNVGETMVSPAGSTHVAGMTDVAESGPGTSFTQVGQKDERRFEERTNSSDHANDGRTAAILSGVGLVLAIVALGGLAVWLSQPRPADKIYNEIVPVAQSGDHSKWVDVRDRINEFLRDYPEEPRSPEVRSWQRDHEWYKQWRKIERHAEKQGGDEFLTPCELAFVQAGRLDNNNQVEEAIAAYAKISDQCSDAGDNATLMSELANHRLQRLAAEE